MERAGAVLDEIKNGLARDVREAATSWVMTQQTADTKVAYDHQTIQKTVIATLDGLVQDWDIDDPIELATRVVADLGFESIDLIQMVAALERAFKLKGGSLVEMLVDGGRYVDDLTVEAIVRHVERRLGRAS